MNPIGEIADAAAIGGVLGAARALFTRRKEMLTEWIAWGMVLGAIGGVLAMLLRTLLSTA